MKPILDAIEICKKGHQADIDFLEQIEEMILDRMNDKELEDELPGV